MAEEPPQEFQELLAVVGGYPTCSATPALPTGDEWRALLAVADLELTGTTRAAPSRHLIEAVPA